MADTLDLTKFTPGQQVRCTLVASPRSEGAEKTLMRLMRQDMDSKRALAKGQRERMKNLWVRSRGGRPWEVRREPAKVVRLDAGASWTMPMYPQLVPDLNSVAEYLKIEKA